jgi:dTDP-4-dehydrorhamnose 3,5-epimerase
MDEKRRAFTMRFIPTELPDVIIIEPTVFADVRGFFMESYHQKVFHDNGIHDQFVQDNISRSVQGTLRGLHYQLNPYAQGKLVRVTRGAVYDVAVDLRRGSPQFGKWVGVELSEENKKSLYIPPGFAHSFYVLSEIAEFIYKCTTFYTPQAERGILWNDTDIAIQWPVVNSKVILSERDKALPLLKDAELNFVYGE